MDSWVLSNAIWYEMLPQQGGGRGPARVEPVAYSVTESEQEGLSCLPARRARSAKT